MTLPERRLATRRGFLAAGAALAGTRLISSSAADPAAEMIVDTHMHTWSGDEARFPFAHPYSDDFKAPEVAATVERLVEDMDQNGVAHAIIVQTIFHGWDNTYTVYSVNRYPDRFVGHGLIDPTDPRVADKLDYWMSEHGLVGMRFSPIYYHNGNHGGDSWITSRAHHRLWKRASRLGAVFNMFIHSSQLPRLGQMVERYPGVKIVVDHVSQIDLAAEDAQQQLDNLLALSRWPNVWVKLTDLTSVSPSKQYPFSEAMPYLKQVYDAFGADRLLWGTGYPGAVRTAFDRPTLARELELVQSQFSFMSGEEKRKYLGLNAQQLWGLGS
jgi:predicted TIM-barrel fold metal-dependent hydrolase